MAAVHPLFSFHCGDTWEILGPLFYADGTAFNLGAGAAILWELRDQNGNVILELTLAGGGIVVTDLTDTPPNICMITVAASQSALIAPGTYQDQLRAIDPSGLVSTQAVGAIEVRASFFSP